MAQSLPFVAPESQSGATPNPIPNPTLTLPFDYNAGAAFLDGPLAAGWGDRAAVRFAAETGGVDTWSYARLAEAANRAGNALRDLGVEMEQRVALLLYDSPEFAASFFGAIKAGMVAVPLNTQLRPQDYLYMLNDSRARALVVEEELWTRLALDRTALPHLRHVALVRRGARPEAASRAGRGRLFFRRERRAALGVAANAALEFDGLLAEASPTLAAAPTTRDDAALWLYSSGSTGFPKGCVHLQHDMNCCVELYAKPILSLGPDDITYSAAKLFFAYGLGNGLYFPLAVGASAIHYPGRVTAESAFRVIAEQRPTIFFGVPTLYASMLALPDAATRFDTSSLRLCVSAGEALPAELYQRWRERFGVEILDGIGSTEALHIFLSNVPGAVVPGSTGRVVPGYEAAMLDEAGRPVTRGEIGNLVVSGDSICAQYWNKHERTKATIVGEWIYTGDKYHQDEAGNYWYDGRADDMLKVSGQWVSPVEVEAALVGHPSVLEAAVVGREDADGLVKPMAFVVLQPGVEPSGALSEELQQHVKTSLIPVKYPRWIDFVAELPKTATGKVQRYILREQVKGRQFSGGPAREEAEQTAPRP